MTTIELKIQILPGNRIIVPGTEVASQATSSKLYQELNKIGIKMPSVVTLQDALDLIPGSRVIQFDYFGQQSRFLVLPPTLQGCPHPCMTDYYGILIDAAREATPEELNEMGVLCSAFDHYGCLNGS